LSSSDNPQFEAPLASGGTPPPVAADPLITSVTLAPASGEILVAIPVLTPPPPRDPVWSGWDVLIIAALTAVSIPVVGVFVVLTAHLVAPRTSLGDVAPVLILIAQFLAYIVVALFMVMLVEGKYHVRFWQAIRWNWPRAGWKWIGVGVLLLLSISLISHFLPMPKSTPFDQFFSRPRDAYLIALFAITLGPLMEELFFRGLLYPVLARWLGVPGGIVLTALPFGLLHMFQYGYAWGVVLLIFLMGVVCTVVRERTGSVAASFLVHVGYNATEMLLLLAATDGFRHMEKAALAVLFGI
jgi:membrane protease YdiL (CAAX protease family)